MRRALLVTAMAGLAGCGLPPGALGQPPCSAVCLHGTFYQPLLAHQDRSDVQWRAWMAELAALGLRRLVLQHVALEPYDVLVPAPGAWRSSPGGAALARILDAALAHGIRVWLGLSYDPMYWNEIEAADTDAVAAYLAKRGQRLRVLAQALKPATSHAGAAGWYISDEIDDLNWVQPERAALLARWLGETTQMLRQTAPALQIAVSGFVHAPATTPRALADQWRQWLAGAPQLDEVLLQDGIGAAKTSLSTWPACLDAVCKVARERNRRCVPVVELFAAATPGAVLNAAPASRVARQMQIAQSAGSEVLAFSVPDFVTTEQPEAQRLRAYFQRCASCDA
jgi:Domain of unknown function (DUF4434)